jgi:predicted metal-dependent hydrolase
VLHIMLPPGERWFCDVYREALPLISDDKLRADVKGFIGQEATHARAHEGARAHLTRHGIDTDKAMAQAEWMRHTIGSAEPFGRTPPRFLRKSWLIARIAIIASVEHFTAVLGDWIINRSSALDAHGADPAMLDLLRWHGAEEVEHRSVAYDVYQHLSGNYVRRLISMVGVAIALTVGFTYGGVMLLRADTTTSDRFTFRAFRRSGRRGNLPTFTFALRAIRPYLRRDYHPAADGDTAVALDYLTTSPGVAAAPSSTSNSDEDLD